MAFSLFTLQVWLFLRGRSVPSRARKDELELVIMNLIVPFKVEGVWGGARDLLASKNKEVVFSMAFECFETVCALVLILVI